MPARFYYDLSSPYAYLAAHRVDDVLGADVEWVPIAFGPLLAVTKRVPWSLRPGREEGMADCERRVQERGLPPIRWPRGWPAETYSVNGARAALVGERHGRQREVAKAVYAQVFVHGVPLDDPALLDAAGAETGIPDLRRQVEAADVKLELRAATDDAIARGVVGIPTVELEDGTLFWGDDRLEEAAAAAAA
ncbi:MAG: DsbA family protein [Actinomycetota bacterium]|nr:DsbA family protein [Actinomycetota bacterium]